MWNSNKHSATLFQVHLWAKISVPDLCLKHLVNVYNLLLKRSRYISVRFASYQATIFLSSNFINGLSASCWTSTSGLCVSFTLLKSRERIIVLNFSMFFTTCRKCCLISLASEDKICIRISNASRSVPQKHLSLDNHTYSVVLSRRSLIVYT